MEMRLEKRLEMQWKSVSSFPESTTLRAENRSRINQQVCDFRSYEVDIYN